MLSRLDEIDWKARDAEHIPAILRQLISEDAKVGAIALSDFDEKIVHYNFTLDAHDIDKIEMYLASDIYSDVLHFVIEIITSKSTSPGIRLGLYYSLSLIAEFVDILEALKRDTNRAITLKKKVWGYQSIYFSQLRTSSSGEKIAIISLLRRFPEEFEIIIPRFKEAIETEKDDDIRAYLLDALRRRSHAVKRSLFLKHEFDVFLPDLVEKNTYHVVRITAAVFTASLLRGETPPFIVDYILDILVDGSQHRSSSYECRALFRNIQTRAIGQLGKQKGIPAIIHLLDHAYDPEVLTFAWLTALFLALPGDKSIDDFSYMVIPSSRPSHTLHFTEQSPEDARIDITALTEDQRAVLQALVRNDGIWKLNTNFHKEFSLPTTQEGLRSVL